MTLNSRLFGRIPSPLEILDAGLDSVAEVIQLPARLGANLGTAAQHTAQTLQGAVDKPKNYAEIPAPPDVVAGGGLDAVAGVAGGIVEGVSGVFQAIQETGNGIKGQLDQLVKR